MEIITTHVNADFDCLGSMIAAQKLYPRAEMVFAGSQERAVRDFLQKFPEVAGRFRRLRDIDLDEVKRLILVDVCQPDRIGPFAQVLERPGVEVHIYDHHPASTLDLCPQRMKIEAVGATVTIFAELLQDQGVRLSSDDATLMLLGLYEDTGKLSFNSTTSRDCLAAAYLLEQGGDLNLVSDSLVQELTAGQVALLHQLIENRTLVNVNGIDIALAHASVDSFIGDLALLAHKLKDMENHNALIVAVRMEDRVFLVGRSRIPEVHVGDILGEFGGGGHGFAGSGVLRDMTLVEFLEKLPEVLRRHVQPHWEARHLLFTAVKTVPATATIKEVRRLLTRYNINALPVMEGSEVVGIISRQVVEKAAYHALENLPVSEYMNNDFITVTPETPLQELEEVIVNGSQRFVPVIEDRRLVGAITRTDLLRHMVSGAVSRRMSRAPAVTSGDLGLKKSYIVRLLHNRLQPHIEEILNRMGRVGHELGVHVFVVGGFVRDLLLDHPNLDIDIVVEGDGIAFAAEYASRFDCRIRTHRKFGTAVLIFADEFKIDVASARTEYYLQPGALPTVEHAPIKLDLYRRDFTINTLAIALNEDQFGQLYDFFGAQRDLQEKAVRVLHNLSFVEDPTRVFRAIRFEQRFDFRIGRHTEQLMRSALHMGFLDKISGHRILNELVHLFKEADPLPAVLRMSDLGLLDYLHPELSRTNRIKKLFGRARQVIDWHQLLFTGEECRSWLVYFLCLLGDLGEKAAEQLSDRLEIPPRLRHILVAGREDLHRAVNLIYWRSAHSAMPPPSEIFSLLEPLSVENLLYGMARSDNESVQRSISEYFTRLRNVNCQLNGHDLKELGVAPGPVYKEIFKKLHAARLDGNLASREDEKDFVRRNYVQRKPTSTGIAEASGHKG